MEAGHKYGKEVYNGLPFSTAGKLQNGYSSLAAGHTFPQHSVTREARAGCKMHCSAMAGAVFWGALLSPKFSG